MHETEEHKAVSQLRNWAEEVLTLEQGDDVIDVGAGTGTAAIALAQRVGPAGTVRGVDVSSHMVAEASRRATAITIVTFSVGDAYAIDKADTSFERLPL